jgi:hypothetical protein
MGADNETVWVRRTLFGHFRVRDEEQWNSISIRSNADMNKNML